MFRAITPPTSGRTHRAAGSRSHAANAGLALFLAAGFAGVAIPAPQAKADTLWRETKRYTAQVVGAYEQALNVLKQAKDKLADAQKLLKHLKEALAVAGGALSNPALAARVAQALAAVTAAEGAVAAAAETVAVTAAAAAAFLGGTAIGQGANYLISWCWDPICEFDGAGAYLFPTDAQVDAMVEQMLLIGTTVPITKADFDAAEAAVPGTGAVAWNYLRQSVRTYSIAARGIGSYTQSHYDDLLRASHHLTDQLERHAQATDHFATLLAGVQTYTTDPRAQLLDAIAEAQGLLPDVGQFPDPVAMQTALNDAIAACQDALLALDSISTSPGGPPQTLDGDIFAPLTTTNYQSFLNACATLGAAGLPQIEVRSVDSLMASLGLNNRGQGTMAHDIAYWDGLGDTANELARFGPTGMTRNHVVLDDSVEFYWLNIDLAESPLTINALASRQNAFSEFELPAHLPGPLTGNGWASSPPLPGSPSFQVMTNATNPLNIPYLMGGRQQIVAAASPNLGQQHTCRRVVNPPALGGPLPLVTTTADLYLDAVQALPPNQLTSTFAVLGAGGQAWATLQIRTAGPGKLQPMLQVLNAQGAPQAVPLPQIDRAGWHHVSIQVSPQTGDITRFTLIDNRTAQGFVVENPGWRATPMGAPAGPVQQVAFTVGGQVPQNAAVLGIDHVAVAYHVPRCDADLTTSASAGSPGYGVPNATLNSEDFFYFLAQYAQANLAVCDLTHSATPGQPGYAMPNGSIDSEDFFFYLTLYAAGC